MFFIFFFVPALAEFKNKAAEFILYRYKREKKTAEEKISNMTAGSDE